MKTWTADEQRTWRQLIAYLHATAPLRRPVSVRRVPRAAGYCGRAIDGGKRFRIYINRVRPWGDAAIDLAEEWAHLRVGVAGEETVDHDTRWSVECGHIRKIVFEWCEGKAHG